MYATQDTVVPQIPQMTLEQVPRDGETRNALLVTSSTGPAAAGRSCDSVIALSPDIPAIMNTMKEAILRAARPA